MAKKVRDRSYLANRYLWIWDWYWEVSNRGFIH